VTEHEWEKYGEWGTEERGISFTYKCKRCGVFKLDEKKTIRKRYDGRIVHEETVDNDESFGYLSCDLEVVKRIMES
jgi:hypothetical protein